MLFKHCHATYWLLSLHTEQSDWLVSASSPCLVVLLKVSMRRKGGNSPRTQLLCSYVLPLKYASSQSVVLQ